MRSPHPSSDHGPRPGRPRILILGGGYAGLYSALTLEKKLTPDQADITLVNSESFMVYQPFLPEAAGGSLEPRHVVIPLRDVLRRTKVVVADAKRIYHDQRVVTVQAAEGDPFTLAYDVLILGLGSVSRVLPIPGLEELAVGFKTVAEAIYLRNQVLSRLDAAESMPPGERRERALTFVFIGAGYAGVEALAEAEDLARAACKRLDNVTADQLTWILVEARDRILPELSPQLGDYASKRLKERGIDIRCNVTAESVEDGCVRLSDGTEFSTETLVWTAGVRAHPLVDDIPAPKDRIGRLVTDRYLRVTDVDDVWAAGDCASIPDPTGGVSPPTAQHAIRQARTLAKNVRATLCDEPLRPFSYRTLGLLASLGHHQGVATLFDRFNISGLPAWFLMRTYHMSRVPTFGRKVRIVLDWTIALFFKRDVVQLGSITNPRSPIKEAFGSDGTARTSSRSRKRRT